MTKADALLAKLRLPHLTARRSTSGRATRLGTHRDARIYFDTGFVVEDAGLRVARVDTK